MNYSKTITVVELPILSNQLSKSRNYCQYNITDNKTGSFNTKQNVLNTKQSVVNTKQSACI